MPFNPESKLLSMISVPGAETWITNEPVEYLSGDVFIRVPSNFQTDLASIPPFMRWFVSNDDHRVRRPAIIHDWIYMHDGALPGRTFSRVVTDRIFYVALREEGVSAVKARLMWLAVRAFGWTRWSNEDEL